MSTSFINDLNLLTDIFPKINYCITLYGEIELKNIMTNIKFDKNLLEDQQSTIKKIVKNKSIKKKIENLLKKINTKHNSVNEWLNKYKEHTDFTNKNNIFSDVYFKWNFLNNRIFLDSLNKMKYISVCVTIIIYVIMYMIFRYIGICCSIKEYFMNIFNSYVDTAKFLLSFLMNAAKNKKKIIIEIIAKFLALAYIVYQIYSFYMLFETSYNHYKKCENFSDEFQNIIDVIDIIHQITSIDIFTKKDLVCKYQTAISKLDDLFYDGLIGYKMMVYKNSENQKIYMKKLLRYIGTLDAYISISKLLNEGYSIPLFLFDYTDNCPLVSIKNVKNPLLPKTQKTNDFFSDNKNLIVITGPNKAGKSTYMRSIFIAILFSQTIGVTYCDEIFFTPFKYMFTYLNISDTIGRESLFEAELNRMHKYYEQLENIKGNEYVLSLIDELFTGTNPYEGSSLSYSFSKYLEKSTKSLNILSTHFNGMCSFENMDAVFIKFLGKLQNNVYIFDYKMQYGVSTQHIAIELFKEKVYNKKIINDAIKNKLK